MACSLCHSTAADDGASSIPLVGNLADRVQQALAVSADAPCFADATPKMCMRCMDKIELIESAMKLRHKMRGLLDSVACARGASTKQADLGCQQLAVRSGAEPEDSHVHGVPGTATHDRGLGTFDVVEGAGIAVVTEADSSCQADDRPRVQLSATTNGAKCATLSHSTPSTAAQGGSGAVKLEPPVTNGDAPAKDLYRDSKSSDMAQKEQDLSGGLQDSRKQSSLCTATGKEYIRQRLTETSTSQDGHSKSSERQLRSSSGSSMLIRESLQASLASEFQVSPAKKSARSAATSCEGQLSAGQPQSLAAAPTVSQPHPPVPSWDERVDHRSMLTVLGRQLPRGANHNVTALVMCKHCGKGFNSYSVLRVHLRSHTGEKPFTCRHCGVGFTQSQHARSHERRVHERTDGKQFRCSMCNAAYWRLGMLKAHERVHTQNANTSGHGSVPLPSSRKAETLLKNSASLPGNGHQSLASANKREQSFPARPEQVSSRVTQSSKNASTEEGGSRKDLLRTLMDAPLNNRKRSLQPEAVARPGLDFPLSSAGWYSNAKRDLTGSSTVASVELSKQGNGAFSAHVSAQSKRYRCGECNAAFWKIAHLTRHKVLVHNDAHAVQTLEARQNAEISVTSPDDSSTRQFSCDAALESGCDGYGSPSSNTSILLEDCSDPLTSAAIKSTSAPDSCAPSCEEPESPFLSSSVFPRGDNDWVALSGISLATQSAAASLDGALGGPAKELTPVTPTTAGSWRLHCTECNEHFAFKQGLQRHIKTVHRRQNKHACHSCTASFILEKNLKQHIINAHSGPRSMQPGTASASNPDDRKSNHSAGNENDHDRAQEPLNDQPKAPKGATAVGADAPFHSNNRTSTDGLDRFGYGCKDCGSTFRSKAVLRAHARVHEASDEFPFGCDICGARFMAEKYLTQHSVVHGEKQFECNVCRLRFSRRASLLQHMSCSHFGRCDYACDSCTATFNNPTALTKHKHRMHSDEHFEMELVACSPEQQAGNQLKLKPNVAQEADAVIATGPHQSQDVLYPPAKFFECEVCLSSFGSLSALSLHKHRVHGLAAGSASRVDSGSDTKHNSANPSSSVIKGSGANLSPPSDSHLHCQLCNRKFSSMSSRAAHMRLHTGERPYACNVCGRRFVQSVHLKSHMRLHTGEKPYVCTICSMAHRHRSGYMKHMRNHHGSSNADIKKAMACHNSRRVSLSSCGQDSGTVASAATSAQVSSPSLQDDASGSQSDFSLDDLDQESYDSMPDEPGSSQASVSAAPSRSDVAEEDGSDTVCDLCHEILPSAEALKAHITSVHRAHAQATEQSNVPKCFSCAECGERFLLRFLLKQHMKKRHEQTAADATVPK